MDRVVNFYLRNILFIMKPFNLELAKAGHPVVTRDGREAKLFYDQNSMSSVPNHCNRAIPNMMNR